MKKALYILLFFVSSISMAQQKFWVEFNTTNLTACKDSLSTLPIKIHNTSNWLSAISVTASNEVLEIIKSKSFVKDVFKVRSFKTASYLSASDNIDSYWDYIAPMKPEIFDSLGLDGKGVIVGIIDAGFTNANHKDNLRHIFKDDRLLAYKDFIDKERMELYKEETSGDFHGEKVFEFLAGYDPNKNQRIGMASGASFYLARTENGDLEHLVEEDDWVKAIEWMYLNDVKLVNTSLGYSEFDDEKENHEWSDMNGRTTMITRAAQKAVSEYGMFITVSAGNSGNSKWRYITAPSDARGVLTVGATRKDAISRIGYSSIGFEFVNYTKPDVCTYSDRGTSYSSPAVCGFVACLIQRDPTLKPEELTEIIKKSSTLYPYCNNFVGCGVPQADIAISLIDGKADTLSYAVRPTLNAEGKKITFKIQKALSPNDPIVLFHKRNERIVNEQQLVVKYNKKIKNSRPNKFSKRKKNIKIKVKKGVTTIRLKRRSFLDAYTTFQAGNHVYEIKW